MKGTVEAISHKNRSVLLSDGQTKRWLNLANNVKPEYIKKGPAEFEIENDTVKFIKASELPERTKKAIDESNINRVASLKFAGNIYQGTGDEENAKRLAEEAHTYLQKGMWIKNEKVE